jgi:carboxypeptidase C (cathepsin A)
VWLSFAGPGCSSIGDGLLSELGPFRVTASEDLILNEHSWNKGTIDQQLILLSAGWKIKKNEIK